MNIEGEEGDAPVAALEAPVIEGEVVENTPEPVAQAEPEPEPKPAKKPADPLISEITKLRARNREQEAAIEAAKREAADARALAERLAKGENSDGAPKATPGFSHGLDEFEVERRANLKALDREIARVVRIGETQFGKEEYDRVRANLVALGADSYDFVGHVMDVDPENAHAILRDIAADSARAIGLVNMNPTQRIAELTRMSMNSKTAKATPEPIAKAATKSISAAPKPAPAISASSSTAVDWRSDKASEEEFTKGFNEMLKNRRARR